MQSSPRLRVFLFALSFSACAGFLGCGRALDPVQASVAAVAEGEAILADPHQRGQASALHLVRVAWGRVVDVADVGLVVRQRSRVIGEDIRSDGVDYQLDPAAPGGTPLLTILHPAGSEAYAAALARLEQGLVELPARSLSPAELPPFPMLPRNAALVLQFDDLLDESSVGAGSVQLLAGTPPEQQLAVRVFVDPHHGGSDREGRFHGTRVVLVPSAGEAGSLPAARDLLQPNLALRLPTRTDPATGRLARLVNLAGNGLEAASEELDSSVATRDLARALRSGGAPAATGDSYQGLLADSEAPRLLGTQAVTLAGTSGGPLDFVADVRFEFASCAGVLRPRVLVRQGPTLARVMAGSGAPSGDTVAAVALRVLQGGPLQDGPAELVQTFDPVLHAGMEACFVGFTQRNPASASPARGIRTGTVVVLEFDEPMDPDTLGAFDGFTLTRVASAPLASDYVVGEVFPSPDLRRFEFHPRLPLAHAQGTNEEYFLDLASGASDLAGNPLLFGLPQTAFRLDPTEPSQDSAGVALRFDSADMLGNDGRPEFRGQFLHDLAQGRIRPRPVTRFSALADASQAVPAIMPQLAPGVQTPLSGLGSRMQSLWRYCDVGLSLLDESTCNVDVEHLYWSPVGGAVVADQFALFEMRFSHSNKLPDESLNPLTLLPQTPNSGLVATFGQNLLDPVQDPQQVVHPRALGYTINPGDVVLASSGTALMPFPLNRGIPPSQYRYYTWRDTALQAKGAVGDSPGAELRIACNVVFGTNSPACVGCPFTNAAGANPTPSIGLPLLMEFLTFPDSGALGLNALAASIAVNSSARPNFRAYSTGGTNSAGQVITINPDTAVQATGGFNPGSIPPGMPTLPTDNTWHAGQADLVLRISRAHSIWFDTQRPAPVYAAPVVEPRAADQPAGTAIELAFRGALVIAPIQADLARDATSLDAYGEPTLCPGGGGGCASIPATCHGVVTHLGADPSWRTSVTQVNGARWIQLRVTFVSNAETQETPTLSALGLAWKQ